jgi:hypothetical protein
MKKIVFVISLLFVAAGNLFAQPITLYKEFPNAATFPSTRVINTTDYHTRLDTTTINIYDENFILVKSITGLPAHTSALQVSKNLFTTSGKYEFLLLIQGQHKLYNEDKQMLYDFGEYSPYTSYGNKLIMYKYTSVSGQLVADTRIYTIQGQQDLSISLGLQGIKGEKGDTGAQGPKGEKGDKGDKGDTGAQGVKGDTGAQGLKGDKGDTGAQGLKGEKGDKGEKGNTGAQGIKGDTGDKGDKGDTGVCDCNNPSTAAKSLSINPYTLSDPYPNPTFSYAKLDYNVGTSSSNNYLVFYDLSGVKRLSVMLNGGEGTFEASKSMLGAGVFMCRIEGSNGATSTCKKLVIE